MGRLDEIRKRKQQGYQDITQVGEDFNELLEIASELETKLETVAAALHGVNAAPHRRPRKKTVASKKTVAPKKTRKRRPLEVTEAPPTNGHNGSQISIDLHPSGRIKPEASAELRSQIMEYVKQHPGLRISEIAVGLGVKHQFTVPALTYHFQRLVQEGRLRRQGRTNNVEYYPQERA